MLQSRAVVGAQIVISGIIIPGNPTNPSAYDGCFPITSVSGTTLQYMNPVIGLPPINPGGSIGLATVPTFCPYLPIYVATSQNNAVYVANYGAESDPNCNFASTDSVVILITITNTITNIAYLPAGGPPGRRWWRRPIGSNLYVLNQGNNSVSDLSPTDLSTLTTIPVANTPAWAVSRPDGQRLYVVTQGDGQLYTINTATDSRDSADLPSRLADGAGANFVLYDKSRNRLYVTNPNAGKIYIFDATTDPPTPVGSASGHRHPIAPGVFRDDVLPGGARLSGGVARRHPVLRGKLCDRVVERMSGPDRVRSANA